MTLWSTALFFLVGAIVGLMMARQVFRGADHPSPRYAIVHGLLVGTGLLLLVRTVLAGGGAATAGEPLAGIVKIALALFCGAALGGAFLLSFHLRKKPLPKPVILVHASIAVTALVLLVVGLF